MFPDKIKYKCLDIADMPGQNVARYFNETNRWIDTAIRGGGKVLVHCFAGISRSPTFVIAFLMVHNQITFDSANQLVRKARYQIYPNPGFKQQLEYFGKMLHKERYQQDQRARFKNDFTTMSASLLKELRKTSTAGLPQDWYQMNHGQTKDRLGSFGLINKGQWRKGMEPLRKEQNIDAFRNTVSTWQHSTPWYHNECTKRHSYYSRSPHEQNVMAQTMGSEKPWANTITTRMT